MLTDQQATADTPSHLRTYPDRSKTCQWIDIDRTTDAQSQQEVQEELRALREQGIHLSDDLIEQMAKRDARAAVHLADHEHLSLVFHAIRLESNEQGELSLAPAEIDLTFGKDHLITVRDTALANEFDQLCRMWQHELPSYVDGPVAFMVFRIIKSVVMDYHEELENIPELLIDLERAVSQSPDELFPTREERSGSGTLAPFQVIQQRIFNISRVLMGFRKYFGPLRRVLDQICELAEDESGKLPFSLQHSRIELYDLRTQVEHLIELVDTYRDIVSNVIGAYQSSMSNYLTEVSNNMADASNRLNVNMQRLTVIATILTTASAVVGFYGMNLAGMGIGSEHKTSALIMLLALVVVGLLEYAYFKRKGWL